MLNQEVQSLIKKLIPVNNQMIITKNMLGRDEFRSIIYRANLGLLDSEIEEFGIFDVSSFLSALELLDDATITLDDNLINATDGVNSLQFITSSTESLDDIHVNESNITTTLAFDSILEFEMTSDIISKIKKASNVFKTFDTCYIVKKGDDVSIKLGIKDSFNSSVNTFNIRIDPKLSTSQEYELAITLESILKIPESDYNLMVKYKESADAYRIVLENKLLTFVLSLKQ